MKRKVGDVWQDPETGKWLVTEKDDIPLRCNMCFFRKRGVCPHNLDMKMPCGDLIFRKIRKNEFLPTTILPPCNMYIFVKNESISGNVVIHEYDESQKDTFSTLCDGWRPIDYPRIKEKQ